MEYTSGNRVYRCKRCGFEVKVNMMLSGVPHCEKGRFDFIRIEEMEK